MRWIETACFFTVCCAWPQRSASREAWAQRRGAWPSPRVRCGSAIRPRGTLWRIDPERNQLAGSVPADGWDLAVGSDGTVWATSGNRVLLGLDRGALRHTLTLQQLGSDHINAITAGPGALWVAAPTGLFRVDLATLP